MNRQFYLFLCALIPLLVLGCGAKMVVPPEVDLTKYGTVGLVDFSCNIEGNLGKFVTQSFLEDISTYQKGARIVELGDMDAVLESIGRDNMDPETIQAIGRKYNVTAVIMGDLEISDIKPKVSISSIITSMSVSAVVEASITAKLLEAESSATVWTDSARDKVKVAQISIFGGEAHFDASDPKEAYGDMADELIGRVTQDFKVRYRRR